MDFGHYTHLITTLIFAGPVVLIEWFIGFKTLKKYIKVIMITIGVSIIAALVGNLAALAWNMWYYPQDKNLGILISGVIIEQYIFAILSTVAVASATLILSESEENGELSLKSAAKKIKEIFLKLF